MAEICAVKTALDRVDAWEVSRAPPLTVETRLSLPLASEGDVRPELAPLVPH